MKILIITPYFPSPDIYARPEDDPRTKFLLRYATEWSQEGAEVTVLHLPLRYIKLFNWAAKALNSIGCGAKLRRFIQNQSVFIKRTYRFKSVTIARYPLVKALPRQKSFPYQLGRILNKDFADCDADYDFIVSDFITPSLDAAIFIRNNFCRKALIWQIFHQSDVGYLKKHTRYFSEKLGSVNGYLFRSKPSMHTFMTDLSLPHKPSSMIYSGVPSISKVVSARSSIKKFIYVGALRFSKNVHRTIESFARTLKDTGCTLVIVGDGPDRGEMENLVDDLGVRDQVCFTGKLTRVNVFKEMSNADCLVMVSPETFGMVYVEAMAHGCIVIAARGQGIDGVVEDGRNGFLVDLNMPTVLDDLILRLSREYPEYISDISKEAIATAAKMDDAILARNVIMDIQKLSEAQK